MEGECLTEIDLLGPGASTSHKFLALDAAQKKTLYRPHKVYLQQVSGVESCLHSKPPLPVHGLIMQEALCWPAQASRILKPAAHSSLKVSLSQS